MGNISVNCLTRDKVWNGYPLNKPGGNNMYGTKNSAEECQALCKATSGCKWFNWDKDKKCWLKTQKGSQMNAKGAVTGPSQCQATTTTTTATEGLKLFIEGGKDQLK